MVKVYLGLGSNLGRRRDGIQKAISHLGENGAIRIRRISSLYRTEPWGKKRQPDFLNTVVCAETSLHPFDLLKRCQSIEKKLGRRKTERFGPREIDIDILSYGKMISKSKGLVLPHPRIPERRFVLVPLCEIAPGLRLPGWKRTISEMLRETSDESEVHRL